MKPFDMAISLACMLGAIAVFPVLAAMDLADWVKERNLK